MVSNQECDAVLNEETVGQMVEDVGPETTRELVHIFTTEARKRILRMAEMDRRRDLAALGREAHALKSSALTYGVDGLGNLARQLERDAREDKYDPELVTQIQETAGPALEALEAKVR